MIEGKWLKEKKEKKTKEKTKDRDDTHVRTRLVTHEEREYLESLNKKRISHKDWLFTLRRYKAI